ncbi:hypothetical protein [Gloeobacter kilaueensis]|uniref:Uncharacterized protein n=1 Tax=Gloeobacter kilaueensis (strain ATCC BAA-2537 / CCAP 1431/1 / ULC 316 / JS1) TaxID=1183438 RepID=U5QMQ2_GLOK1|nr:hypothetical protein [Gloeobacter kilaueensis]AGY60201.1 hypothetical protein GKIL_3955 [Gloeobacter kilaueensis JS1]
MSISKTGIAMVALCLLSALPAVAQTSKDDASQLTTVPARTLNSPASLVTGSKSYAQDLNAEESRYRQAPANSRWLLRRSASPVQRVRGNNEATLYGDQPDAVTIVDIVEW